METKEAFDRVTEYLVNSAKYNWVYFTHCIVEEWEKNPKQINFTEEEEALFRLMSEKMKEENVEKYVIKTKPSYDDKVEFATCCGADPETANDFVTEKMEDAICRMTTKMIHEGIMGGKNGVIALVEFMKFVVEEAKLHDYTYKMGINAHLN